MATLSRLISSCRTSTYCRARQSRAEHAQTRHNAGFWFVDELARAGGASSPARIESRHGRQGAADGREVWLLYLQTFMNRSGLSVVALAQVYRILPDEILRRRYQPGYPARRQIKLSRVAATVGITG